MLFFLIHPLQAYYKCQSFQLKTNYYMIDIISECMLSGAAMAGNLVIHELFPSLSKNFQAILFFFFQLLVTILQQ